MHELRLKTHEAFRLKVNDENGSSYWMEKCEKVWSFDCINFIREGGVRSAEQGTIIGG